MDCVHLVFKAAHQNAVTSQLTHVHAAQFPHLSRYAVLLNQRLLHTHIRTIISTHYVTLECGPMPNVMAALPNIGGALCSMPQSLADAHY